jgi:hypothetical protein
MVEDGRSPSSLNGERMSQTAPGDTDVLFVGPFSAKQNTLLIDLPVELAARNGLYLWTVDYDSGYLVNYVGKTIQGFSSRFYQHKKWYESGKDVLDPDYLPKGENWLVENPSPELTIKFFALYRVFVAAMSVDEGTLLEIEKAIVQKLLSAGGKCEAFLGNKQRGAVKAPSRRIPLKSQSLIHGMGDHVLI